MKNTNKSQSSDTSKATSAAKSNPNPPGAGTTTASKKPDSGKKNILKASVNADGHPIVQTVLINLLRWHPSQVEIYGELDPKDPIIKSVHADGILHPPTINERGEILSGSRRVAAAKIDGKTQIQVIVVPNRTFAEEVEYLILSNLNRVKTPEEVAREAAALMKIETAKAAARQAEAGRAKKKGAKVPVKSTEAKASGEARNIVGKQLGIGGSKVTDAVRVVEMLDQLEAEKRTEDAAELRGYLNKSISQAAKKLVKFTVDPKPDEETPDEKEEPTAPVKGDLITDVWISLSAGIHKWDADKINAFKTAVLEFRKGWETGYAPEVKKEAK